MLNRRGKCSPLAGRLEALECRSGGVSVAERIACAQALLNNRPAGNVGGAHAVTCCESFAKASPRFALRPMLTAASRLIWVRLPM